MTEQTLPVTKPERKPPRHWETEQFKGFRRNIRAHFDRCLSHTFRVFVMSEFFGAVDEFLP